MRFGIVGVGPVGGVAAAYLIKGGHNVTLVDIAYDRLQAMQEKGLRITDPRRQLGEGFTVQPASICPGLAQLDRQVDVLIISVKAYILRFLLKELKQVYRPGMKVVAYLNGLDCEEILAEAVGPENVLRFVVNYAGQLCPEGNFELTFFNGPNFIGAMEPSAEGLARELADIFTDAGLPTESTTDIKLLQWKKTLLNAALAPVTAVTGLTMKEVMDEPELRKIVEDLLREGLEEGRRLGVPIPDNFYEKGLAYLEKGGYHKPSMLIDVEMGLPTEIDFMNGKIEEYGRAHGTSPTHRIITALVRGLEARNRKVV